jgi:hypothetical protein
MKNSFLRKFAAIFFLSVFFIKMLIGAVPLVVDTFDSKLINAVIMQLEEENHSEKSSEKIKESFSKGYCNGHSEFSFSNPSLHTLAIGFAMEELIHIRTFYPSVPTPPPSV